MLKIKIKAGSIANLTDARYFAAREVDWLGFDFSAGSESYITPAQMLAIKEWVDGVKFVGEFNLESVAFIRSAVSELQLDAVQIGMVSPEETLRELVEEIPVIKEIVPNYYHTDEDLLDLFKSTPPGLAYFVLNLEKNGFTWTDIKSGAPFTLAGIKAVCEQYPVLLALNFKPAEVTEILDQLPIQGLHLRGGEEEKVGLKSFDELDEILDWLEEEG